PHLPSFPTRRSSDLTMHEIKNTIWETGFAYGFAEQVSSHRSQFAWLCDCRVADRDCGRDFPAQQIQRQIPGRDESGDAARLTQRVVKRNVVGDVRFRFGVQDRSREKPEVRD